VSRFERLRRRAEMAVILALVVLAATARAQQIVEADRELKHQAIALLAQRGK
jgi:hypothetical protein